MGCIERVKFTRATCEMKMREAMELGINTRSTTTGWIGTFEDLEVEVMKRKK
jgi:hypothetical protein